MIGRVTDFGRELVTLTNDHPGGMAIISIIGMIAVVCGLIGGLVGVLIADLISTHFVASFVGFVVGAVIGIGVIIDAVRTGLELSH